ncbi:MAG TPA: hypothetical protein DEP99_04955 [Nitrospiraceae bacterium]|nr:hypothetical protein [Nitrospiraceae bacterium]
MRRLMIVLAFLLVFNISANAQMVEQKGPMGMGEGQQMIGQNMMMRMDNSQARLKCDEQWLKNAIALYELHTKDPNATPKASQIGLLEQLTKIYECIYACIAGPAPEAEKPGEIKKEEPPKQ